VSIVTEGDAGYLLLLLELLRSLVAGGDSHDANRAVQIAYRNEFPPGWIASEVTVWLGN
jgi:hypothetical protein